MISGGIELAGRVGPRRRARGAARPEGRAVSLEVVAQLDARLAELARGESGVRLALAEALEALASRGGHFEMGFSSLEAYARERCGRSRRWASESRTLARRLAGLPALRGALVSGAVGWCMADLVARFATPESDGELTRLALGSTVRAMREHFAALKSGACQMSATVGPEEESGERFASCMRVESRSKSNQTTNVDPSRSRLVTWSRAERGSRKCALMTTRDISAALQRVVDIHRKPWTIEAALDAQRALCGAQRANPRPVRAARAMAPGVPFARRGATTRARGGLGRGRTFFVDSTVAHPFRCIIMGQHDFRGD